MNWLPSSYSYNLIIFISLQPDVVDLGYSLHYEFCGTNMKGLHQWVAIFKDIEIRALELELSSFKG